MVKHAEGGWAPGDVRTAAVMTPEGLLDHEGMMKELCGRATMWRIGLRIRLCRNKNAGGRI